MNADDAGSQTAPGDSSLVCAVVVAVAEARGVAPEALPPLYDAIDPDALERLFAPCCDGTPRADGHAVFPLAGCEVTVRSDRTVAVRELEE